MLWAAVSAAQGQIRQYVQCHGDEADEVADDAAAEGEDDSVAGTAVEEQ
jgi:hypothetical protein